MTLMQRLNQQSTGSPEATRVTRAHLMAGQGYTLRHDYALGALRCPWCADRLTREEWGQTYHATIGLDVCRCGFTSQRFCIA